MEIASLYAYILVSEQREQVLQNIKQIQEKLQQLQFGHNRVISRYEILIVDWISFSIDGISWEIGIQLQEVLEELQLPVFFIGSQGSGLTDLTQIKKGKFDHYFLNLLEDTDSLDEFLYHFISNTSLIDYILQLWQQRLLEIIDTDMLRELQNEINYGPLKAMIIQRIDQIEPPDMDPEQNTLDDYF